ncbi:hypothetical protein ABPG74_014078 [Tetrahymena malaccensis]
MKIQRLLIAALILCLVSAQLRLEDQIKKEQQSESWLEKLLDYFRPKNKLSVTTECNALNFTAYDGLSYSGYLSVGKNLKSALGFIFYGAKGRTVEQIRTLPTIIWLNGGPGCSSQFGNFFELGPLYVNQTSSGSFYFTPNNYTWTNEYNVIFVDQPVGTGISYADTSSEIPQNQDQVAQQFLYALDQLYNTPNGCFNQVGLTPKSPLFIFGESYAGKYVPSIAARALKENNIFNIQGIGVVDGFTVPYYVVGSLSEFSHLNNLTTNTQYQHGLQVAAQAQKAINSSQFQLASSYFNQDMSINNPQNLDVYNIHRKDEPDASALDNLFNSAYGQQLFKLRNKKYSQCDNTVYARFANDFMKGDTINAVEYLLEQDFPVNYFNGNLDLIVPYIGTQQLLSVLNWSGQSQFNSAPTTEWAADGAVYGTVKTYKNLQYKLVYNSGHMVPQDQPAAALNLVTEAVNRSLQYNQNKSQIRNY